MCLPERVFPLSVLRNKLGQCWQGCWKGKLSNFGEPEIPHSCFCVQAVFAFAPTSKCRSNWFPGSVQQRLALFYLQNVLDGVVLISFWAKNSAVDAKSLAFFSRRTPNSCPLCGSRLVPKEQVAPNPLLWGAGASPGTPLPNKTIIKVTHTVFGSYCDHRNQVAGRRMTSPRCPCPWPW